MSVFADGYDTQVVSYIAPTLSAAWHLPPGAMGPVFAVTLLGSALGSLFLAPLADRWGRKRIIVHAAWVVGVFTAACSFATTLGVLELLRFCTGLGLGAALPNAIALVTEYAPSRRRVGLVTLTFCGYPVGAAFGAFAAGIGTTDLEVGILKGVCAFRQPKTIKFNINGQLPKGVYAKDVILHIIGRVGVNGATDRVMEFHGSTVDAMTMESRMTLCNMAIEAGGTSGICQPDATTVEFLWPFIKDEFADQAAALADYSKWRADADAEYDQVIEIDVTTLQPVVTFGYKPDQTRFVGEMPDSPIDQVYLGSCTNGRLEDLRIAAAILKGRKLAPNVRGILSPATPKIQQEAMHEGLIDIFMEAGFCVTNPTCGACLGMSNGVLAEGEVCASTTNRNFMGRMGKGGMVHLMSPATAAASGIEGKIADPRKYL